jgi:hypothetical protein
MMDLYLVLFFACSAFYFDGVLRGLGTIFPGPLNFVLLMLYH